MTRVGVIGWGLAMALAGCGPEHPPPIDTSTQSGRGGSRGGTDPGRGGTDAGAGDTGNTGNTGKAGTGNSPGVGTACQGLDSDHAHYYGAFEDIYDDTAHALPAIATQMDGSRPCINYVTPYLPTITPDQSLLYVNQQRKLFKAATSELAYSSPNQLDLSSDEDELIETKGCPGDNLAVFHVSPVDGSIIYNCGPYRDAIDIECEAGSIQLKPFEYACIDGPYYRDGEVVFEGPRGVHGFAADGRWVITSSTGPFYLAYWDPVTLAETPFTGTPPTNSVFAGRVAGDALSLVYYERNGSSLFWKVSVDSAGEATTEGQYGPSDELIWVYASYGLVLDAADNLYMLADLSGTVLKAPFEGAASVAFDPSEHPGIDVDNAKIEDAFVFADYQSPLFSGPALRF